MGHEHSGDRTIVIECLPGSELPDRLRDAGYTERTANPPEGERFIASAIAERLVLSSSGAYELASEGSTKAIITPSHSGIVKVRRFTFSIA